MDTDESATVNKSNAQPRLGAAIASLVLGICSIALSFIVIGVLLGLVGLILGVVHLREATYGRTMAKWGTGLSALGIVTSGALLSFYIYWVQVYMEEMDYLLDDDEIFVWEGVIAPDLEVSTLAGENFSLSDAKGKRVIIDIWATWCGPCVDEIQHFNQLRQDYSDDELIIIGLTDEDRDTVETFMKDNPIDYLIATDQVGLPDPYGAISSYPTTFFIDRNGVIQDIVVGYEDLEPLRTLAMAPDFEGEPLIDPVIPQSELTQSNSSLTAEPIWSIDIDRVSAMAIGDWTGDDRADVLVSAENSSLHIIDADGRKRTEIDLPNNYQFIEFGEHVTEGPRLLGYDTWDDHVMVMDSTGTKIWRYQSSMGIDGAHWGDLDGDGTDEMIVGMNGGGGLHAVSASGKRLWKKRLGNVWNQSVISATAERPALVVATEAGGTVRLYDSKGGKLDTLRPGRAYISPVLAAEIDPDGRRQILAIGESRVYAMDVSGTVAWSTPVVEDNSKWVDKPLAFGDLTGDGTVEWLFVQPTGELVVASPEGIQLGQLDNARGVEEFAVLPLQDGTGLLVTQRADRIDAYRLVPVSDPSE